MNCANLNNFLDRLACEIEQEKSFDCLSLKIVVKVDLK